MAEIVKWEYKVVYLDQRAEAKDKTLSTLNELGREGWELVTLFLGAGHNPAYFKRRIA